MITSVKGLCLPLAVATLAFLSCTDQMPAGPDMDLVMQAAKGAPGKPGGGGGGGHAPGTLSNNLSLPTVMVGSYSFSVTCDGSVSQPQGSPLSGYPLPGDYYVQGQHAWQAPCVTANGVSPSSVTASWGDNLSGDAKLKVGKPIRVELGLVTTDLGLFGPGPVEGFTVDKLEPNELDRVSEYGTLATPDGLGGFFHQPEFFSSARVYDDGVTFSVQNVSTGAYAVAPGANPTAEINATGKVVYGYNLRVTAMGQYLITFDIPTAVITDCTNCSAFTANSVEILINVVSGGGGGGGQGGGHGG
jgi:hypothetical protein